VLVVLSCLAASVNTRAQALPSACASVTSARHSDHIRAKADYYVSPKGDDHNPGTYARPFRSVEKAYAVVTAGQLVYFRGGKYPPLHPNQRRPMDLERGANGTPGHLIKFWAYPGEVPIIDLSGITASGTWIRGVWFVGDYWHWKGFEVTGFPSITYISVHQAFTPRDCNNCIFENFNIHDNYAMGFVLGGNSTGNLILNSDSYNNQDPETTTDPYGNADGFHIAVYKNPNATNTIRGCRAWYNSDDGYDCFKTEGHVLIDHCWSFWNGYVPGTPQHGGDGSGFKLGESTNTYTDIHRTLIDCICAANYALGFDLNDGRFAVSLNRCISYCNGDHGVYLSKYAETNLVRNCISIFSGSGYDALITPQSLVNNCSWVNSAWATNSGQVTARSFATNFISVDVKQLLGVRNPDNTLPSIASFQLATNSSYHYQ
jgi:hypothetical protein